MPSRAGRFLRPISTGLLRRLAFRRFAAGSAWLAILLLVAAGPVGARMYDSDTSPRAKLVAPVSPWPGPSFRAKDFALVKKDAWYHVFYTRVQRFVPRHYKSGNVEILNETSLGHAVSRDLETWMQLDTVLAVRPGMWDSDHVWAPSLVELDGVFWMFYSGVKDEQLSPDPYDWIPAQQKIGVAYSTDVALRTWTRLPEPVWQPCAGGALPGVPWATCDPILPRTAADFRDPFVLPPSGGSHGSGPDWLLYYTARPRVDEYNYVVGVAGSGQIPAGWTDRGALWDTYNPTVNSKIESPHVFRHDGDWHMLFSGDERTNGILWLSSLNPATGPWATRGRLIDFLDGVKDVPYDFDLDPVTWFASEHFSERTPGTEIDYLCVVHAYDAPPAYNPPSPAPGEDFSIIEFRQMLWNVYGQFSLVAPSPVRSASWARDPVRTGQQVDLVLEVSGAMGREAVLESTWETAAPELLLEPESTGLPTSVILTEPWTIIPWTVTSPDPTRPLTLRVRVVNQPLWAEAGLTVLPTTGDGFGSGENPPIRRGLLRTGRAGESGDPAMANPSAEAPVHGLRTLRSTPLGPGTAFLIELPGAARARLDVFDVNGRRVSTVCERELPPGGTIERWDGRDATGLPIRPGLYFARLTSSFGVRTDRVLILR